MSVAHPKGQRFDVQVGERSNHQRYLEMLAEQMDAGVIDLNWGERSLAALELCEAAYLSNRIGGVVRLPLADFVPPALADWDAGRPYAGLGGGRDGRKLAEVAR
jgi:hypothetical protein